MLGLGWGEILLVLVLALVVIGPKHLPEAARSLGKTWAGLRRAFEDATGEIRQELRQVDEEFGRAKQDMRSQLSIEAPKPEKTGDQGEVTADPDLADFVGEITGQSAPTKPRDGEPGGE